MTNDPIIDRALVLLKTNRPADAEQTLLKALIENPQNPLALGLLAATRLELDKKSDALEPAKQALALEPDNPWLLTIYARVLFLNNNTPEARRIIQSAIQMDPTYSEAYSLMAQIEYHERRWEMALYNAEQGLEHDPEDQTLINLRAMALVKLNRTSEAVETMDYALQNNPESSFSHSNKGWVQVEQGEYDAAVASFKEALRFDPNNESAREGLKQAIKGKNWLYRSVLRYFLFMGKLTERNQWLVIIGLYIAFRVLNSVAKQNDALRPFIAPLLIAYIVFVFATWIGTPLSNLVLRLHPVGKLALTDDEKRSSNLVGLLLVTSILVLIGSYLSSSNGTLSTNLAFLSMTLFAMLIPLGGLSSSEPGSKARQHLTYLAIAMFVCGPVNQLAATFVGDFPLKGLLLGIFALGIIAYGWVANYILMQASKRF